MVPLEFSPLAAKEKTIKVTGVSLSEMLSTVRILQPFWLVSSLIETHEIKVKPLTSDILCD